MSRRLPWIRIDRGDLRGSGRWRRAYCPACEAAKGRRPSTRDLAVRDDGYARCFGACELSDGALVEGLARGRPTERWRPTGSSSRPPDRVPDPRWVDGLRRQCRAIADDGPVSRYLRRRGFAPPWPASSELAEHPSLRHSPSSHEWPAMIGTIRGVDDDVRGVLRTYLTPDGSKAPVEPQRMFARRRSSLSGGAVRVHVPDGWAGRTVAVCEGIETALGLRLFVPTEAAVWACLSASMLAAVELPPTVTRVIVAPDHDRSGAGFRAMARLQARLARAGVAFEHIVPPLGSDFADLAQQHGGIA